MLIEFVMHADQNKIIVVAGLVFAFLCYSIGLYSFLPVTDQNPDRQVQSGKLVWQRYNCVACHQIYGLGGYLGPDLTNIYSKRGPAYTRAFIQNGTDIMPNLHLTDQEIDHLLAYLQDIDQSGTSDPRTFTIKPSGAISQP